MKFSLFLKFLHLLSKLQTIIRLLAFCKKSIRLLAFLRLLAKCYTFYGWQILADFYVCWRFTFAGKVLYVCWRFTYAGVLRLLAKCYTLTGDRFWPIFTFAGKVLYVCWRFTFAGATPPPPPHQGQSLPKIGTHLRIAQRGIPQCDFSQ